MNDNAFLAFKRGPHPARDGRGGEVELEVGFEHDFATEIDRQNGWNEPEDKSVECDNEVVVQHGIRGLREMILFCFQGHSLDPDGRGLQIAIRRFIAVSWMLHSNEMRDGAGKPLSLERLSKLPQVKCTRCALSLLAQEFGKPFGFRVRVQKRDSSKPNYAASAKTGWKKRRARERARANASVRGRAKKKSHTKVRGRANVRGRAKLNKRARAR